MAALVVSAIAGGFGGAQWFKWSLLLAGGLVLFILAVAWLTHVVRRSADPAPGGRSTARHRGLGFTAMVALGAVIGGGAGTLVPTLLGGDIPLAEGISTMAAVGATLGGVVGTIRMIRN